MQNDNFIITSIVVRDVFRSLAKKQVIAQRRSVKVVLVAEVIALFAFDYNFQEFLQMLSTLSVDRISQT